MSSINPRISPLTIEFKCPQLFLFTIASILKTNKSKPYNHIPCSQIQGITCIKRSVFLKVIAKNVTPHSQVQHYTYYNCLDQSRCLPNGQTSSSKQKSNYELFNRNNFNICFWSWNYRGCWHQTCPPIDTKTLIYCIFIPITKHGCFVLLYIVTTSLCQDWVICAPAAFLRCGSRFTGFLSGIKP